jgi:hypothetical protein
MTNDPITALCRRTYTAAHNSGTRDVKSVRWIVMHSTEGATAESAASWFTNPKSQGSAHLCVDDTVCFRTATNETVVWGAPGANEHGFHIEQAGFARWSAVIWRSHRRTLQRAAYKAALHCRYFGIEPVFVTAPGLNVGRKGITTHAECTKAFGGDHTDPGPLWPRRYFMRLVRGYYAELGL